MYSSERLPGIYIYIYIHYIYNIHISYIYNIYILYIYILYTKVQERLPGKSKAKRAVWFFQLLSTGLGGRTHQTVCWHCI